jgi:hypothetical protein
MQAEWEQVLTSAAQVSRYHLKITASYPDRRSLAQYEERLTRVDTTELDTQSQKDRLLILASYYLVRVEVVSHLQPLRSRPCYLLMRRLHHRKFGGKTGISQ